MILLLLSCADANIVSMTDAQWAWTVDQVTCNKQWPYSHSDNELQGLPGSALRTVLRPEGLLLLCIVFGSASKHSRRYHTYHVPTHTLQVCVGGTHLLSLVPLQQCSNADLVTNLQHC